MEKIVDDNTYYMNYSTTNYCRNNKKTNVYAVEFCHWSQDEKRPREAIVKIIQ